MVTVVSAQAAFPGIDDLDALSPGDFATAVAPLFEGGPRFLARLAAERPFGSVETMFVRARAVAHAIPEEEQVELVDAHPRLGAPPGSVSALSSREQGYDAAPPERTALAAKLDRLNDEYETRFGFRYCVFVAGRPRDELVPELAAALARERADELRRALDAVVDIAIDRHARLTAEARP
jgi:2-oxo-4-hydroxy-4-carboxy--5-ureidoimidazoline (OHCU) decarboxylase